MARATSDEERAAFRTAVGGQLRKLRQFRGLSQEDLADRAGMHRTFLGAVERGQRATSHERLLDLAVALDVEPGVLIPAEEEYSDRGKWDGDPAKLRMLVPAGVDSAAAQQTLDALVEDLERRNGPVTEEERAAVDREWRGGLSGPEE